MLRLQFIPRIIQARKVPVPGVVVSEPDQNPPGSAYDQVALMVGIRIRISNADPDPGAGKLTKWNYKPDFRPFKNCFSTYVGRYVLWPFTDMNYFKKSAFSDCKVWPVSALIWLPGSGSVLTKNPDPDPHWNQGGSIPLPVPIRFVKQIVTIILNFKC